MNQMTVKILRCTNFLWVPLLIIFLTVLVKVVNWHKGWGWNYDRQEDEIDRLYGRSE